MILHHLPLLLLVFFFFPSALSATSNHEDGYFFTDDQAMRLVKMTCPSRLLYCPKADYRLKDEYLRTFDETKVRSSPVYHTFRKGNFEIDTFISTLRKEFCCVEGPCLQECGIFPIHKTEIISNFPNLYKQLFKLNLPELNQYQQHWQNYQHEIAMNHGHDVEREAEIEELYDLLHKNEDQYMAALNQQKL